MKILLSYSKLHFDPTKKPEQHKYWDSSANILARSLYEILSFMGEVTYVDAWENHSLGRKSFDLFVGINSNFTNIAGSCDNVGKKVLFAVNMHPTERNELLSRFADLERLPKEAFAEDDLQSEQPIIESLEKADYILCVGNNAVYSSYIKHGIPPSKIKMLNYGVGEPGKIKKTSGIRTFTYVASSIGLRKGFDIVLALIEELDRTHAEYRFNIIGPPSNDYYKKKLESLGKRFRGSVIYHNWLDSSGEKYQKVLSGSDFVINPSLEEGQAGTVLDAIRFGAVPLLSINSGIDYSPLGLVEMATGSVVNKRLIAKSLALSNGSLDGLKLKTREYYQEYHQNFMPQLQELLEGCMHGKLYPKISVVLPIFNKEKTIEELLGYLDTALKSYGNSELHIIFDGCKDNTKKITRRFYRGRNNYSVTFEATPNIFEVKTNNIGLRKSSGKYGIIIQDDIYIYDPFAFYEAVTFLDKNPTAAILGGLAGVNYYPLGTKLKGSGQIAQDKNEVYWRQDEKTDPTLRHKVFEVDACMRGPLILRKSFLDEHGYLDEIFAPFYMDDMDIGLRAKKFGYKVYCMIMNAENKSQTVATYDTEERKKFWQDTMDRNTKLFYERWTPTREKNYSWVHRPDMYRPEVAIDAKPSYTKRIGYKLKTLKKAIELPRKAMDTAYCHSLADSLWQNRMAWVDRQARLLPKGTKVLDVGAGELPYKDSFAHCEYVAQDLVQTPGMAYGKIDIVSDITDIPVKNTSFDAILCSEVFEHIPDPPAAIKELARILKPGGRLIFTAPLGSGHHQQPYHFYGGLTRYWYEKFLPENDLTILDLQPNGGLFGHCAEMLWRTHPFIMNKPFGKTIKRFLQFFLYNIPTLLLWHFEERRVIEDFTVCFFCTAVKEDTYYDKTT
ncbi:MAG TPA: methyltransferase domain-containing protein [Candidatus Saccharimonadales bacterium]|nr:methyltransferase domain-containing protein [Candidatus Saccharimonadales bacterium]